MNELVTPPEVLKMVSEGKCALDSSRGPCPDGCELWEATVATYETMLKDAEKKKGTSLTAQEAVDVAALTLNTVRKSTGTLRVKADDQCVFSTTKLN